jgi:hypothetical protein
MNAGSNRPLIRPAGVTTTLATAVVDPSSEKFGHTKFPRP